MLSKLQQIVRWFFMRAENLFNLAFGEKLNPFYHLGTISFWQFWLLVGSGLYLYIFADTGVQFGLAPTELRAQAPTVKNRQPQRGRNACLARTGLEQAVQPQRVQAHESRQIDVGIELAAGCADALRSGLNAPARSDDVGPPAQQIGAQHLGYRGQRQGGQSRRKRVQRVGCLTGQHGDLAPSQRRLFVQGFDLRLTLGQGGLRLCQLHLAVQAGADTLAREALDRLALRKGLLGDFLIGQHAGQCHVGPCQLRRQGVGCGRRIRLRRARLAQRGLKFGTVQAKEVGAPAERGLQVRTVIHVACHRRRHQAVGRVALARGIQRQLGLRTVGGVAGIGQRCGLGRARARHRQAGLLCQGLVNQGVELCISQGRPPADLRQAGGVGTGLRESQSLRRGAASCPARAC